MVRLSGASTLAVFSHPNHELAIFGLLQRLKPRLVFLTDGGGPHRIKETENGLRGLGLLDRATFLNHTEQSFYDALLRMDSGFFSEVACGLRPVLEDMKPDQVFCDAVEFYNPVHDMTLGILANVYDDWDKIFEVPLLYQKPGQKEEYGVQTAPPSRSDRFEVPLTEAERNSKRRALDENYLILKNTLGPVLLGAPQAMEKETLLSFQSPLRWPGSDYSLRYDRRGNERRSAGEVSDVIRHEIHFVNVVSRLIGLGG